jgi:DNA-binding LacI/PurR family transcriptional regulator
MRTFVTLAGGDTAFAKAWADGARPSAVLAASDIMAIGAMRAAKRLGLQIPKDLEVIGFDDIPLAAASDPALTTVHQPIPEKGRVATRLLIRELDEGGPRERIVLPTELLLRESTRAQTTKSRALAIAKGGTEREGKRSLKAAAR